MPVSENISKYLSLLFDPGAIRAIATWPIFSITSYKMLAALARRGIVPRTVIDVGANAGQFTVASAMIFPNVKIHAFEPVPEIVLALSKNARNLPNVTIYPLALGDGQGECSFHVNCHSHSSSILPLGKPHLEAFPNEREARIIRVELSTLDAVFDKIELTPPILLKLDVQGYEAQTLKGGSETLKRCDYVVAEASFEPLYKGETSFDGILELMAIKDFAFLGPVGWLTAPRTGEVLQLDALFRRKSSPERRTVLHDSETTAAFK